MTNRNQVIECDQITPNARQGTETGKIESPSNRLVEQLGLLVEEREQRRAAAAEQVARQERRTRSLAGAGAAFGFFGWMFWLMATFDSSRNAWFGAGFWIGLFIALSAFVLALVMRRRNIARIVEDVARDLGNMDREIKDPNHKLVIANTGADDTHRHLSTPLEPFVVKSKALVQVVCASALIILTGFGFLFFSSLQSSKARLDRLEQYKINIGGTAYNVTSGVEIGRIVGVEVTTMNGPEQVVYRIDRDGRVASFPVTNVMVREAP